MYILEVKIARLTFNFNLRTILFPFVRQLDNRLPCHHPLHLGRSKEDPGKVTPPISLSPLCVHTLAHMPF